MRATCFTCGKDTILCQCARTQDREKVTSSVGPWPSETSVYAALEELASGWFVECREDSERQVRWRATLGRDRARDAVQVHFTYYRTTTRLLIQCGCTCTWRAMLADAEGLLAAAAPALPARAPAAPGASNAPALLLEPPGRERRTVAE